MTNTDHLTLFDRAHRWRAIEAAAQRLVDHLDDPYSGADDGRFDAERWELRRDELEKSLRAALTSLPTPGTG